MKLKIVSWLIVGLAVVVMGGDTVRPGLERLSRGYVITNIAEKALVEAIKEPFLAGYDVSDALEHWFAGRLSDVSGKIDEAIDSWHEGLRVLKGATLKKLPKPPLKEAFPDTTLNVLAMKEYKNMQMEFVEWKVDGLTQYGVVVSPKKQNAAAPVLLYLHGAAFGIPFRFLVELGEEYAEKGYVIIAPALRGEPLFQANMMLNGKSYKCEGEIENLDGEIRDCLSMLNGIWKRSGVVKGEYGIIGHSFGAGVGLVTAAVSGSHCKCVVSYDAWLVNPQRYYWDRMRRWANNWLSWEDYCNQPVQPQLTGLMKRSVIHRAEGLEAPLLLFIGGGYEGSVFHQSHEDLITRLKELKKPYEYVIEPEAGHNFVLYTESEAARDAQKKRLDFIQRHLPVAR